MDYTLSRAAALLQVSRATLHRWLRSAQLEPTTDPMDRTRRLLSRAQVVRLARLHKRVILLS